MDRGVPPTPYVIYKVFGVEAGEVHGVSLKVSAFFERLNGVDVTSASC
jgi:hypothetical protein